MAATRCHPRRGPRAGHELHVRDGISTLIPNKPGMSVTLQYPPSAEVESARATTPSRMEPQLARHREGRRRCSMLVELAQTTLEGHDPQRRHARRRRADQRPASSPTSARCTSCPAEGVGREPVRQGRRGSRGPREVRLSGPGHAHRCWRFAERHLSASATKGQENFASRTSRSTTAPTYALFIRGQDRSRVPV